MATPDALAPPQKPRKPRWLIACAGVLILNAIAHTIAQTHPPQPDTPELIELERQMTTVKLHLPGAVRTAQEMTNGWGWLMVASCLGMALTIVLMLGQPPAASRRVAIAVAFTMGVYLMVSVLCIFVVPIIMFGLVLLLAVLSLLLDDRAARAR
jgi:hypothetical protein